MTAPAKRGRRPDPAKDAAILEAASAQFIQHGYSVSIDDIASAAGVSKQTVYARFASKEDLFEAAVREGANQLVDALFGNASNAPLAEALSELGLRYQEIVLDPQRISMQRLLIAQAQQFPDLAHRFYESGPGFVRRRLADYLQAQDAAGRLSVSDADEAAEHFLGLVKGADQLAALLCVSGDRCPVENRARLERAVEAFLKIYAPE